MAPCVLNERPAASAALLSHRTGKGKLEEARLEAERLESDRARRASLLLESLCREEPLSAELREFAERLGFPLGQDHYRPFSLAISGATVSEHARHADELRSRHILAVNHGKEISGLVPKETQAPDVGDKRGPPVVSVGASPQRRRDDQPATAEIDERDERSGGVKVEAAMADQPHLRVEPLEPPVRKSEPVDRSVLVGVLLSNGGELAHGRRRTRRSLPRLSSGDGGS